MDASFRAEAKRADPRRAIAYVLRAERRNRRRKNMQSQTITGGLAVTAMWEARDGEADTVADILARFAPQARREPGVQVFMVQRALDNPAHFLFFEVFDDAAAYEAHQQTPHFKALILGEGLPRLNRRERRQYAPI
jgi:quinol monooxygenase YgiN